MSKKTPTPLSFEDLREALYYAQDVFDRCLFTYFLTEETLLDASLGELRNPPVFGTTKEDFHNHAQRYLREIRPDAKYLVAKGGLLTVKFDFNGVPITLKSYQRDTTNRNLDVRHFMYEWWKVPNNAKPYLPPNGQEKLDYIKSGGKRYYDR